jgi:hypothetical protein
MVTGDELGFADSDFTSMLHSSEMIKKMQHSSSTTSWSLGWSLPSAYSRSSGEDAR